MKKTLLILAAVLVFVSAAKMPTSPKIMPICPTTSCG